MKKYLVALVVMLMLSSCSGAVAESESPAGAEMHGSGAEFPLYETVQALADAADCVVIAQANGSEVGFEYLENGYIKYPFLFTDFVVDSVLQGDALQAGEEFTTRENTSYEDAETGIAISGPQAYSFTTGGKYILFLRQTDEEFYITVGAVQGVYIYLGDGNAKPASPGGAPFDFGYFT